MRHHRLQSRGVSISAYSGAVFTIRLKLKYHATEVGGVVIITKAIIQVEVEGPRN